ncbi:hypothetical protein ACF0H5_013965 [Mactra antiquata]
MPVQSNSSPLLQAQLASTMEPSLQSKKRVEPPFLKTVPAKSDFDGVPLQSKKRVTSPSRNKPIQCEPPLQSKRRTPGPPTTLSNGFHDNGMGDRRQDYALLGNQDKFSSNVKYVPKGASNNTRDISPPKQMKLQPKVSKENRNPSPAPKVNTDQFKKPSTPLAPRRPKGQSDQLAQELKESNLRKEPKVTRSPKQSQSEPKLSKTRKEETNTGDTMSSEPKVVAEDKLKTDNKSKDEKLPKIEYKPKDDKITKTENKPKDDKITKTENKPKEEKMAKSDQKMEEKPDSSLVKGEEVKNLDRGDPVKDSMKSKKIVGNMNEFAQTNMDKGVMDSAPEAPADYALRYKTGISAPRPTKKVSEYQKQFAWKSGPPASPLLDAEQVVYNSNPQLSPPKKSVIPKVTEYQKQFKAYKLVPVEKDEPVPAPQKRTKLQKSKSMENLSPAEIKPAGSAPVISPNNKRLTMETDQKVPEPVPEVPKRKSRLYRSEYRSNFKEPERFDYVRGSWHGAAPPHVQIKGPEETVKPPALATWFAEVIELRRKAQEYRQRALGTHFSREHMAQLMAKQNDLWEASTPTARSTISALSLESGIGCHKQDRESDPKARRQVYREADSTAATMDSQDDQSTARLSEVEQPQKKQAWADDDDVEEDNMSQGTPSTYVSESPDIKGRLPTPVLRQEVSKSSSQKRRHHLDRTTPSTGGAILSSPPDVRKKKSGKRMVARSVDSVSLGTVEDETPRSVVEHQPLAGQKTYKLSTNQGNISAAPTFGMPSRDTHALRDDDASVDKELRTQFVYTPVKPTPGGLSGIDENYGQTYNKSKPDVANMKEFSWGIGGGLPINKPAVDDDDILSVSMQSIASSCSLASATLERARKRKDEFWGAKTTKAK